MNIWITKEPLIFNFFRWIDGALILTIESAGDRDEKYDFRQNDPMSPWILAPPIRR